jgi:hypothetical protein
VSASLVVFTALYLLLGAVVVVLLRRLATGAEGTKHAA